ncbi:Uncharacterised protein [Mycobacteroides abscessus subsp. abscessus]|nr:Uncharacterised protein [Mycobacteroides abscessus subsp. abscessus]
MRVPEKITWVIASRSMAMEIACRTRTSRYRGSYIGNPSDVMSGRGRSRYADPNSALAFS